MSRIFSSRRLQRPQVSRITVDSAAALLLGAGIGAGVMYLYDPARGRRRRRLIADRVTSAAHRSGDVLQKTGRDLKNHARGLAATARRPFRRELADDPVVYERVRSELGRVVSHPGAIDVTVGDGIVTLAGDVIDEESEDLLDCIADVRGVRGVVDHLTRHDSAEDVPVLQGDGNVAASRFELLQEHWTPAARLMTGLAGSALLAYSMRARYRAPTAALGAAGAGMLLRAATNMPFERLTGVGAGHRAITVRKSINIDASVDEVYGWLTEWERWPQWMSHVREVNVSDQPRGAMPHTRWVVDGPAGTSVSWDAAVTRLVPNELIAWKTVGRSPVRHAGRIRLTPTDQGATRVDVQMSYNPVLGAAGHAVAKLFRRDPERQLHDDLSRLKTTIETGTEPHDAAATRRRDTSAGEHPPIL